MDTGDLSRIRCARNPEPRVFSSRLGAYGPSFTERFIAVTIARPFLDFAMLVHRSVEIIGAPPACRLWLPAEADGRIG